MRRLVESEIAPLFLLCGGVVFLTWIEDRFFGIDGSNTFILWVFGNIVLVGGVLVLIGWRYDRDRAKGLRRAAARMGYRYRETGPLLEDLLGEPLDREDDDGTPAFHLFREGSDPTIGNLLEKSEGKTRFRIFDFSFTSGSGKDKTTYSQTVLLIQSPGLSLPAFAMTPEGLLERLFPGKGDIDFSHDRAFSRRYFLRGSDEAAVRALFNPELTARVMPPPPFSLEGHGEWLLFYRRKQTIAAEKLEPTVEAWQEVLSALELGR